MKHTTQNKFEPFTKDSLKDPMPSILKKLYGRYNGFEPIYRELVKALIVEHGFKFSDKTIVKAIGKVLFESNDVFYRFSLTNGTDLDNGTVGHRYDTCFVRYENGKLEIVDFERIRKLAGWEQHLITYMGSYFKKPYSP